MRSDREHCALRVAVEQEEEERRGGEEQATDIKSNNPHLAGGEFHLGYKQQRIEQNNFTSLKSFISGFFWVSVGFHVGFDLGFFPGPAPHEWLAPRASQSD